MESYQDNEHIYRAITQQRKRKSITLEMKIEILKRLEDGERQIDLCRAYHLAGSTVRTILKNKDRIIQYHRLSKESKLNEAKMSQRSPLMHELEHTLKLWMEQRIAHGLPVKQYHIKQRAKEIHAELKKKYPQYGYLGPFKASAGWMERFKRRLHTYWLEKSEDDYLDYLQEKQRIMSSQGPDNITETIVIDENSLSDDGGNEYNQPGCSVWLPENNEGEGELYSENDTEVSDPVAVTIKETTFKKVKIPTRSTSNTPREDDFIVSKERIEFKKRSPSIEDPNPKSSKSTKEELSQDEKSKRQVEFEAFAKSIVLQLCSMPYEDALKLQLKIQTLVTEERLKSLEKRQEDSRENGNERDTLDLTCVKTEMTDDDDESNEQHIEHCNVPVSYSIIKPELIIKEEN